MNQFINFFWTIICFAPVLTYWFKAFDVMWLIIAIAISLVSLLIPGRVLQLSYRPKFYERLGIRFIRKFVQNGDWANRLSRIKDPQYKHIRNRSLAPAYHHTIVMYERFHFMCLVLFFFTAILAFADDFYWLSIQIIITNTIYNIAPILLQQYNKARLLKISK
ncbi:hypothetical protein D0C36_06855 [Mucilaginibacter conchicola]|uniref:Glycosyl-4,4'-diaponeurosporenoate acyltransferase n=1 Tax=Mucilaginibacter conchicola TaxID=2303333 RepID=A0A372NYQ5_9SPHI|nr:hypothetical protein [Mucilaginibacter conchicola]RFZ95240.1 hypothetical protein D0C36_06855 [Mucilaginibacter conchicola]